MWVEAAAFFLAVSLLFYCLFAGADFGAGVLECFRGRELAREQTELVTHAMGPVWEANHVWLVLAVVVFFNGFPPAFSAFCIRFHIPLTLVLVGVILRGCAFTFRHYDAVKDGAQRYYDRIFQVASVLTPVGLGMIAGGVVLGRSAEAGAPFWESYLSPWLNAFAGAVGLFTALLFAFLAAVYLVGETESRALRALFVRRARAINLAAVIAGALVFASAEYDGFPLARRFVDHPLSLASMALATLLLAPLWLSLNRGMVKTSRIFAAAQVALVLAGGLALQYPVLLAASAGDPPWTVSRAAAPEATLQGLLVALLVGVALIFPALFALLRIFKRSSVPR